ncbi:hypothetical protein [Rheinheimera sp.]|uniref:hypothetical protein n=1 Tax=Rheinheimera sp. TaxID=1869214 RepID=UPI00307D7DFD
MRKFLLCCLLLALTLTFYDHPRVFPYTEPLLDWLAEHISLPTQNNSSVITRKVQKAFYAIGQDYGSGQQEALARASADLDSLLRFKRDYCQNGDFHPVLFGEAMQRACEVLKQYPGLKQLQH